MTEHSAARLLQHEGAQLPVTGNKSGLLPDRLTRRRQNTARNDVANFTLCMALDDLDCFIAAHVNHSLAGLASHPIRSNRSISSATAGEIENTAG